MADNKSFESTLHDIVYSIDTGTGLKIIRVMLYVIIIFVLLMLYTATQFRGLKTEESMDLAQLGRNMSIQNGMMTKTVRPLTMWKMQDVTEGENPQIWDHPDLLHPPAYPALLSVGFKLFDLFGARPFEMPEGVRGVAMPAEQWIVLPINYIFALLTGLILFSLGKRMFSREIGFLGMTIYYLSSIVWEDSSSGLNISMAVFFSVAAFYAMVISMLNRRDEKTKMKWLTPYFISIVLTAIAFLTRYITIAIIPGICIFAWLMCGRSRGGTRFVLVFLVLFTLLISPWLARNYKVCGNPMGMVGYTALADTPVYPDNSLVRDYDPTFSGKEVVAALKGKWILNYSGKNRAIIPAMGGGLLMAFFLTAFFYHFVRPQVNYLRWGLGVSLLLMVIIAGFFSESSMQMLHLFWPFVILYGLAFFYVLIDRLDMGVRLYSIGLKVLIAVLASIPFWLTLMPPQKNHPYPPYHAPIIGKVAEMLTPREVLCTDMPWATAWYGDRTSILLPKNLDQFYDINDYKQYISGMYFTTITKNKPFVKQLLDGPEKSWLSIMSGRYPNDFPLKEGIALSGNDQLFLSDSDRWSDAKTK